MLPNLAGPYYPGAVLQNNGFISDENSSNIFDKNTKESTEGHPMDVNLKSNSNQLLLPLVSTAGQQEKENSSLTDDIISTSGSGTSSGTASGSVGATSSSSPLDRSASSLILPPSSDIN